MDVAHSKSRPSGFLLCVAGLFALGAAKAASAETVTIPNPVAETLRTKQPISLAAYRADLKHTYEMLTRSGAVIDQKRFIALESVDGGASLKALEDNFKARTFPNPNDQKEMLEKVAAARRRFEEASVKNFARLDADADGTLSEAEFMGYAKGIEMFDTNQDGIVTYEEIRNSPPLREVLNDKEKLDESIHKLSNSAVK